RAAAGCRAATRSGGMIFLPMTKAGGYRPGLFYIHDIYQFMLLVSSFLDTYHDKYYFLFSDEGKIR
ncbi:hypothetical protein, partial [Citrobacter sp.]|uniref:hypothetical protein n=1 Tax=Citrobacter sp. TaxID=1896336 RepID=UPI002FC90A34